MEYTTFDKKTSGSGVKNKNISNKEFAEELHEPIIRKFDRRKYNHLLQTIFGCRFTRYAINK